jgi:transposase
MPLLQAIPPIRGKRGRPRSRAPKVYADRGYDHDKYRVLVRQLGTTPVIARRGTDHGSGLGKLRWVVEQSFALLHWFRRLRILRRAACGVTCNLLDHDLPPCIG